ncbi:MAG: glycosyltransferase, partial [Singulisphaera sp.]
MKIAQIAPLFESVPPKLYGGTERVVSFLTEELVRQGHDVTLFASGDSTTSAQLVPIVPHSLRLDEACVDQLAHHVVLLEEVAKRADEFDVLHFHIDYLHYPVSRRLHVPQVTTLHGRLDIPDLMPLYREFHEMPVVSISDHQRRPLPDANWQATIYHGLPPDLLDFHPRPDDYLAFLGRISKEKRPDRAIEIAKRAKMQLKIAAKVDDADREYLANDVEPLL